MNFPIAFCGNRKKLRSPYVMYFLLFRNCAMVLCDDQSRTQRDRRGRLVPADLKGRDLNQAALGGRWHEGRGSHSQVGSNSDTGQKCFPEREQQSLDQSPR